MPYNKTFIRSHLTSISTAKKTVNADCTKCLSSLIISIARLSIASLCCITQVHLAAVANIKQWWTDNVNSCCIRPVSTWICRCIRQLRQLMWSVLTFVKHRQLVDNDRVSLYNRWQMVQFFRSNSINFSPRASSDTVSCTFSYHTWHFIIFTIFTITACIFSYSLIVSSWTQDLSLQQILSSIDLFLYYRTDYTDSRTI